MLLNLGLVYFCQKKIMKRFTLCVLAVLPLFAFAQSKEGRIIFKETIKLEIQLSEGQEHMAAMMPTSQSFDMALLFNEQASLYQNHEAQTEEAPSEWTGGDENATVRMVIQRPENQVYQDLKAKKKVESRDFLGKRFLIQDDLKAYQWKLSGEQQTILGYPCFKAEHRDSNRVVVAWFTPQIPVSSGPDNFGQLPGMILSVDIDGGKRSMVATEVTFGESQEGKIEKPSKGKEVTQAEFDQIQAEKMKEMGAEEGGGGTFMIKIRN